MGVIPGIKIIKVLLVVSTINLILLSFSIPLSDAADSSCVQCHTDEKQLKTLYKPQKVVIEQGES